MRLQLRAFAENIRPAAMQALNIPTKINKGTVEITTDVQLIHIGEKVRACQGLGFRRAAPLRRRSLHAFTKHICAMLSVCDGALRGSQLALRS